MAGKGRGLIITARHYRASLSITDFNRLINKSYHTLLLVRARIVEGGRATSRMGASRAIKRRAEKAAELFCGRQVTLPVYRCRRRRRVRLGSGAADDRVHRAQERAPTRCSPTGARPRPAAQRFPAASFPQLVDEVHRCGIPIHAIARREATVVTCRIAHKSARKANSFPLLTSSHPAHRSVNLGLVLLQQQVGASKDDAPVV